MVYEADKMAKKTKKIDVQGVEITILTIQEQDYISLTDMVRDIENGSALIENWLRNKNSIEFLGIWKKFIIQYLSNNGQSFSE